MRIAVLYIGTGRYTIFWEEFYKSCEKFFIKNAEKHYFFFTDSKEFETGGNVTVTPQENLGWPLITCLRYKIFNKIHDELKNYDYIFFFNGNMEFIKPVTAEEFLPTTEQGGLVAVLHPLNKRTENPDEFPYERSPKSNACIAKGQGKYYFQAAILGGKAEETLKMFKECEKMTDDDLKNNIIPIFHDESMFNKYILDKKYLKLGYEYMQSAHGKPWVKFMPEVKIIQRDKAKLKYGGHAWLRGETDKKMTPLDVAGNLFKSLKK